MLVLSRKEDQKVCFPGLGITVQVLRVKGSSVRLGVEAPMEVRIIRDELDGDSERQPARSHTIRLPQNLRHKLRNELNSLSIGLHLFKQELQAGRSADAEATFAKLIEHLERVCSNSALSHDDDSQDHKTMATALLVEDEPNEREMLAGFLRMNGYTVVTASDGLEALEYLESNDKPSVVLIDMRMPRCDGPTAIRRIRANPTFDDVRLFAISGSTPEENHLDTKEDRLNGWFVKPLNPKSLVDAMAVAVRDSESIVA